MLYWISIILGLLALINFVTVMTFITKVFLWLTIKEVKWEYFPKD